MDIKLMLKNRRKELGLTMKQLSEMVKVSESTISRWESGKISNMTRENISMLAKALKINPSEIMGWENEDPYLEDIISDTYDKQSDDGHTVSINFYGHSISQAAKKHDILQTEFLMIIMDGDDTALECYLTKEQKNVIISMVKSWGVICCEREVCKNV